MTTDRDDLIAEAETHYIVAKSVYENLQGSLARALLEISTLQNRPLAIALSRAQMKIAELERQVARLEDALHTGWDGYDD